MGVFNLPSPLVHVVNTRPTKCTSSTIRVENIQFYTKREGPTLKASSPLLDTCQAQHPLTLAYQRHDSTISVPNTKKFPGKSRFLVVAEFSKLST